MAIPRFYKIIIAENSPIIALGLNQLLLRLPGFQPIIKESDTKSGLLKLITTQKYDLILVNPTFGGLLNPEEIRKISQNPDIRIIAIEYGKLNNQTLALFDDHIHVTDSVETISMKICPSGKKSSDYEIKDSLSNREREIVSLVVKGHTNQEIADKLFLSVHTVITHRRNIARKLEIHSVTGLTIYAIVNKIVDLSEIKI